MLDAAGLRKRSPSVFGIAHELSPQHRSMRGRASEAKYPHLVVVPGLTVQEVSRNDDFVASIAIYVGDRRNRSRTDRQGFGEARVRNSIATEYPHLTH